MKSCRPVPYLLLLAGLWLPWAVLAGGTTIDTGKLSGTWQALESHPEQGRVETLFTIRDDISGHTDTMNAIAYGFERFA